METFPAYWYGRGNDFEPITVTSVAEQSHYSHTRSYWITKDGKRSKESDYYLYAATPENDRLIERWRELETQINKLSAEQKALIENMAKIAPTVNN